MTHYKSLDLRIQEAAKANIAIDDEASEPKHFQSASHLEEHVRRVHNVYSTTSPRQERCESCLSGEREHVNEKSLSKTLYKIKSISTKSRLLKPINP